MGNADVPRICSTVDRLAFGARWTRSEVNVGDFMPTRMRCRDNMLYTT
jgi:hypothetical protein